MNARLTFIHAFTALHPGVGQGAGIIDLPVAREKATGIPFLPGSSLKGALRTRATIREKKEERNEINEIFGFENIDETNAGASMIQFSDQRLLLLPVRSLAGTFAWVTCPYILDRLARDSRFVLQNNAWALNLPDSVKDETCWITQQPEQSTIVVQHEQSQNKPPAVYLEDLNLKPSYKEQARTLAQRIAQQVFPKSKTGETDESVWQKKLVERFCIVSDDVMSFLLETATEVTARIHLQESSKTVEDGGLWYEEALPAETILVGLSLAMPTLDGETKKVKREPDTIFSFIEELLDKPLQLGGKATVGRGLCQVRFEGKESTLNAHK